MTSYSYMRNAPKERWLSLQVRDFLSRIRVVGAEMDDPCRRRERYRQGGGHGFLEAWVCCASLTPVSTTNLEDSTAQCQSGDRGFGCGWGRGRGLFYCRKRRVRHFRLSTRRVFLNFECPFSPKKSHGHQMQRSQLG